MHGECCMCDARFLRPLRLSLRLCPRQPECQQPHLLLTVHYFLTHRSPKWMGSAILGECSGVASPKVMKVGRDRQCLFTDRRSPLKLFTVHAAPHAQQLKGPGLAIRYYVIHQVGRACHQMPPTAYDSIS